MGHYKHALRTSWESKQDARVPEKVLVAGGSVLWVTHSRHVSRPHQGAHPQRHNAAGDGWCHSYRKSVNAGRGRDGKEREASLTLTGQRWGVQMLDATCTSVLDADSDSLMLPMDRCGSPPPPPAPALQHNARATPCHNNELISIINRR